MADASNLQANFLGGEWSKSAQGRADQPQYADALNVCRNGQPIEEGAWTRRSGDRYAQCTRNGSPARVIDFNWSEAQPWTIEFTDGFVRLYVGAGGLLMDPSPQGLVNISSASPAVFTIGGTPSWNVGDFVIVASTDPTRGGNLAPLRNRQLKIATISGNNFTATDPYTGAAINGNAITFDPSDETMQVTKVFELVSPYISQQWRDITITQTSNPDAIVIWHPTLPPYVLAPANGVVPGSVSEAGFTGSFGAFTLQPVVFVDGPYLDAVVGSVATPGGLSGVISFAIQFAAYNAGTTYAKGATVTSAGTDYISLVDSNTGNTPASSPTFWQAVGAGSAVGPNGFQSTDIGRSIRIHSEPPVWVSSTAYATGANVTYNGAYYQAIAASTGAQPDTNLTDWLPTAAVDIWTWGRIVSINSATSVQLQIVGPALLYDSSQVVQTWQLGAFTATPNPQTGIQVWPRNGAYYEGRLWMSGAIPNRVDGSMSDNPFDLAPTLPDGTVTDASAITAVFNSTKVETILWLSPSNLGLIAGTQSAEWLIQASQLGDPITPTSIQAHPQTKYGSSIIPGTQPVNAPLATLAVSRFVRKIFEFVTDVFSGRLMARNLLERAKHLTAASVEEITYTQELVPTLWARIGDGSWIGCTYRRDSAFATEGPVMYGWHRHDLGSGRIVESITSGPSVDGQYDTPCFVTNQTNQTDPQANIRHVTYLSNTFQETDDIYHAAFVDDGLAPLSCTLAGTAPNYTSITFYGLWHLNGESVAVFSAGQDLGQHTIANGQVTVNFSGTYTFNALQALANAVTPLYNYGSLSVEISIPFYTNSGVVTPKTMTSYIPPAASPGNFIALLPDWIGQRYYIVDGLSSTKTITQFAAGNQTDTAQKSFSTLGISAFSGPNAVDPDGNFYGYNGSTLQQIVPGLTLGNGVPNNVGIHSSPSAVLAGVTMAAVKAGTHDYLVNANTSVGITEINVSDMTAGTFAGFIDTPSDACDASSCVATWVGPANSYACVHTLAIGGASASRFGLYVTTIAAAASTYSIGSWPTQNPYITTTRLAQINPAQIDAQWTSFQGFPGLVYDATDHNLIASVQAGNGGVTTPNRLVKINAVTGAIMWNIPNLVLAGTNTSGAGQNLSRVAKGQLLTMTEAGSGNNTVSYVNTITGTITSTVVLGGVNSMGRQLSDDVTGTFLVDGTYSNSSLTNIGTTPGSYTFQWGDIAIGTSFIGVANAGAVVFPTAIGFTFTSQGQRLRQLSGPSSGARNGPALGKTRRNFKFGALLAQTQGISFGTEFSDVTLQMLPADFRQPNGALFSPLNLFNGVYRTTVEARYDYDNMLAWQITRPYPAIVVAVGDFVHTQDL